MDKNPDYAQLFRLAQSPEGQKLWKLLQQSGSENLKQAMTAAASGDFQQAKSMLSPLLSSKEAEELLTKLEERL